MSFFHLPPANFSATCAQLNFCESNISNLNKSNITILNCGLWTFKEAGHKNVAHQI